MLPLISLLLVPPKVDAMVFVLADCPIARKYSPEIRRVAASYPAVPLRIVFVDSDIDQVRADRQLKDFGLRLPADVDSKRLLARKFGIDTVPTAVVRQNGKVVYKGRIDDRFPTLGVQRTPRQFDLRNALEAAIHGRTPTPATTKVVGCHL